MLAEILETIRERLGVPADRWLIGEHERQKRGAPPRYVWVPGRDVFAAPMGAGGRPRPLRTRVAALECHIWSDTFASTENALHALVAALHADARTSFELGAADWDRTQATERGQLVTLAVTFAIPVTDATLTTGITTGQATGYTLDGPPVAETGDGYLDSDE
jgi:hypothetical protein